MQDDYALLSYTRSWAANRKGLYIPEVIPFGDIDNR